MHVGNGATVSVKVIWARYLDLENVYFILNFSRNMISISVLAEQSFGLSFNNNKIFVSKNDLILFYANLEDGLYILNPY